ARPCAPLLSSLLLVRCVPPHPLPSFPPRRSSDLARSVSSSISGCTCRRGTAVPRVSCGNGLGLAGGSAHSVVNNKAVTATPSGNSSGMPAPISTGQRGATSLRSWRCTSSSSVSPITDLLLLSLHEQQPAAGQRAAERDHADRRHPGQLPRPGLRRRQDPPLHLQHITNQGGGGHPLQHMAVPLDPTEQQRQERQREQA